MSANHKYAKHDNVRERRADRLARAMEEDEREFGFTPTIEPVEVEAEAGAQASEASDSAEAEAETVKRGFENPITYGAIDG